MPFQKLKELLETSHVPYQVESHPRAYTSQGVAAALHVKGREFAKCVIVKTDAGRMAMMVIPGPRHVDLNAAREALGARGVELAREDEFSAAFPGCEPGAEPPFGNLFGLPVYVDESLRKDTEIVFNAGTHVEAIRMKYADFERLVHPVVARVSSAN